MNKKIRRHKSTDFFGGATLSKHELFGRVAIFRLAQDFRTDWVSSPSTGGGDESRTRVQKPIPTGISERRCLLKFP